MAEIEKIAVYDARIIQDPPKYAVQKGAISVSTSQYQATAANANQLQFQVIVPSLNVFTDRKIELNASPYVYTEAVPSQIVTYDAGGGAAPATYPAGLYIQPPNTASQCYTIDDQPIPATYPPTGSLPPSTIQFNGGNTACVLPADSWPGLTGSQSSSPISLNPDLIGTFGVKNDRGFDWDLSIPTLRGFPASTIQGIYQEPTNPTGNFIANVDAIFESKLNQQWYQVLRAKFTIFPGVQPEKEIWFGFKKVQGGNPGFTVGQKIKGHNFQQQFFTWIPAPPPQPLVSLTREFTIKRLTDDPEYDWVVVPFPENADMPEYWFWSHPDLGPSQGGMIQAQDNFFQTVPNPSPDVPGSGNMRLKLSLVNVTGINYNPQQRTLISSTNLTANWSYAPGFGYLVTVYGSFGMSITNPNAFGDKQYQFLLENASDEVGFCGRTDIGISDIAQMFGKTNISMYLTGSSFESLVAGGSTDNYYQSIGSPTDLSLGLFPIQSLARTMTGTINDCTVSVTGDTFHEQLLISQTRDSLMQRTCASKYDVYAWSADDVRASNGATQGYELSKDSDIPNGSSVITFVNPTTGKPFNQFDAYRYTLTSGDVITVPIINYRPAFIPLGSHLIGQIMPSSTLTYLNPDTSPGQPVTLPGWPIVPTEVSKPLPLMFTYQSVEPLCLSPLLWQDSKQMTEVGLYGTTNMTLNMTLNGCGASQGYEVATIPVSSQNPIGRQYMDKLTNATGSYSYMTRQSGINALFGNMRLQPPQNNLGNQTGPWLQVPRLMCTFLTPPPEITLPLVSSVPYVEFPRYNSVASATITPNGTFQVASNTVTLSSIPDLLVVFVRPAYRGQTQGDTYMPIGNIAVTFDNYSNLCNNYTQEDLYACSVAGGLDMDFQQFRGFTRGKHPTLTPASSGRAGVGLFDTFQATSGNLQTTGSPVLLRMGQDVPLSSGLAPGTLGNYSVQVNLTIDNRNGFFNYLSTGNFTANASGNVIITIMAVNSGFFESVRGSSAIRKTILNTNDVETASSSSSITSSQLVRMVGGASGMHTSSRLTTSMGLPSMKIGQGSDERMRKMARHSSMLS